MSSTQQAGGAATAPETVSLKIDGKPVTVKKGTNLIEAARGIGVEIPHYCYHRNLSVAGNCRMCQVEVVGAPKLEIGCNCIAREGMDVKTQATSKLVADAQAATLEFILINHPLDCTVCDQAGHCKLQDYHFEYNAKDSRFLEPKEHKVKALPLGPHVVLDGERCILCTRCVRFCDEITGTKELGVLHRGDRSVITVAEGKELNNPLSGTVVDLCPVGALTHRDWRFNSRIWFSKQTDTICPGCSTGCNVKIAVRDGEVVQVKARDNQAVNKEWMCDEGRYGMGRFLPKERVLSASRGASRGVNIDDALAEIAKTKGAGLVIFASPLLTTEEMWLLKALTTKHLKGASVAVGYRQRPLSKLEQILVSPDYAANIRGAVFAGLTTGSRSEAEYSDLVSKVRSGGASAVLILGERGIDPRDLDPALLRAISAAPLSLGVLTDGEGPLSAACGYVIPGRSVLEKAGIMINRDDRAQWNDASLEAPRGTESEWRIINRLAIACGAAVTNARTDRELTMSLLGSDARFSQAGGSAASIAAIKAGGVSIGTVRDLGASSADSRMGAV
jgi:NADH-quinone oxidoreductase subunit G